MIDAFMAALSHPDPSARLLATYGDYAWNVLDDHELGERMTEAPSEASPERTGLSDHLDPHAGGAGRTTEAGRRSKQLETLNIGGRLDRSLDELRALAGCTTLGDRHQDGADAHRVTPMRLTLRFN